MIQLSNLQYANQANTLINMTVDGWLSSPIPYTYNPDDHSPLSVVVKGMLDGGGYVIAPYAPPVPPVPQSVTRRQMLIGLVQAGYITAAEGIAAAQTVVVPAAVQAVFNTLPDQAAKDAATITWASMSECLRSNSLVAALAAAQNPPLTSQQVDALFQSWVNL